MEILKEFDNISIVNWLKFVIFLNLLNDGMKYPLFLFAVLGYRKNSSKKMCEKQLIWLSNSLGGGGEGRAWVLKYFLKIIN